MRSCPRLLSGRPRWVQASSQRTSWLRYSFQCSRAIMRCVISHHSELPHWINGQQSLRNCALYRRLSFSLPDTNFTAPATRDQTTCDRQGPKTANSLRRSRPPLTTLAGSLTKLHSGPIDGHSAGCNYHVRQRKGVKSGFKERVSP